jgi:hypothetical protein
MGTQAQSVTVPRRGFASAARTLSASVLVRLSDRRLGRAWRGVPRSIAMTAGQMALGAPRSRARRDSSPILGTVRTIRVAAALRAQGALG